ncbi:MAG TPA: hypothetical protein VEK34_12085 [Methylocella sp.]|nr:hypothetical protein [Methylocella sp.]
MGNSSYRLLNFLHRRPLWFALLVAASLTLSLGFACAVPLAAFAAIAALTLSRRDAFFLTGAVWLANQLAGFTIHHYPLTLGTLGWGAALGAVALAATVAAQWVKERFPEGGGMFAAAAFLAAFAVYEGSLFVISLVLGSGLSNFTPSIVRRIFAINATAFAVLYLLDRLGVSARSDRASVRRVDGGMIAERR